MISAYSPWLAAHGKLWYDDKFYRTAWIIWPQAMAALVVMWFWATPSTNVTTAKWGVPLDTGARYEQLRSLRDTAKSDRSAMDTLERTARGGEMSAQFFYGSLFDPNLKLSSIVQPDFDKSMDWYNRAGNQGEQIALNNLTLAYSSGQFTRVDYTRACYYALKLNSEAAGNALRIKGDCYARGLGGTRIDQTQADTAYKMAESKGAARTSPSQVTPVQKPPQIVPSPVPQPFVAPTPTPLIPSQPDQLVLGNGTTAPVQSDTSSDQVWGAMAFTADGSYSTAWKAASQPVAEAKVATQCSAFGRGSCKVLSFSGQDCVALSAFSGRRWRLSFTAGGTTYPEAQRAAMDRCNSDDRTRGRCVFKVAVCADGR